MLFSGKIKIFCSILLLTIFSGLSFSSSLLPGLYKGKITNDSIPEVILEVAMTIHDDSTGYFSAFNRRGHYDSPIYIEILDEVNFDYYIFDRDNDKILFNLRFQDDSIIGIWGYEEPSLGFCGNVVIKYNSEEILVSKELYALDAFVSEDFIIPEILETDKFRLRMLTVDDAEKDYDAVMSSAEYLREMSGGLWPSDDMTLEDNIEDLKMHQREFIERKAYLYSCQSR